MHELGRWGVDFNNWTQFNQWLTIHLLHWCRFDFSGIVWPVNNIKLVLSYLSRRRQPYWTCSYFRMSHGNRRDSSFEQTCDAYMGIGVQEWMDNDDILLLFLDDVGDCQNLRALQVVQPHQCLIMVRTEPHFLKQNKRRNLRHEFPEHMFFDAWCVVACQLLICLPCPAFCRTFESWVHPRPCCCQLVLLFCSCCLFGALQHHSLLEQILSTTISCKIHRVVVQR